MSTSHYPQGEQPSTDRIKLALGDAVLAIESEKLPYLLMGGAGTATYGRPRATDDIDLFVRSCDARRALDALEAAGFETDETDPQWLHKAYRHGVLVDVIFRSAGEIYLDDEMLRRGRREAYLGVDVTIMSPEDLLVIKAIATTEETSRHWYDGLALIARSDLDWDYAVTRARRSGPRRVLSLLMYAESNDLSVPSDAIESLFEAVHPRSIMKERR